ncbi:MAG: hypothetical protein JNN12_05305 [Bacteroidetes Order II. Incertae sedis bacterium]|nr:hypothetical protein [Bacteroidetes Order II. bacterium]
MEAQSLTIITTIILVLMLGTLIFSFVQYWLHRIRERQARKDEEALRQIGPPKPYVLTEAATTTTVKPTVPPPVPVTPKAITKTLHKALASQNEHPTTETPVPKKEKTPFTVTMLEPPTGERKATETPVSENIPREPVSETMVGEMPENKQPEIKEKMGLSSSKTELGEHTADKKESITAPQETSVSEIRNIPQVMLPDMPTTERSIDEVFTPPVLSVSPEPQTGDGVYSGGDSAGSLHAFEDLVGPEPLVLESIGLSDVQDVSPLIPSNNLLFMVPVELSAMRPRMTITRPVPKKKTTPPPAKPQPMPHTPPPPSIPPRRDEKPEWN